RAALGDAAPAAEGGEPMSLDARVVPPKVLYRQTARGIKVKDGKVVIESVVDREGGVVVAKVVDPGKAPELAPPVLQAVRHWGIQPARHQDQPVKVRFAVVYKFVDAFDWSQVPPPVNVMDPFNNPYAYTLDAADYAGRRH